MRISDWSSDVCSSDLDFAGCSASVYRCEPGGNRAYSPRPDVHRFRYRALPGHRRGDHGIMRFPVPGHIGCGGAVFRSEEHTSELQSLMRISYAVFCLKKKKYNCK